MKVIQEDGAAPILSGNMTTVNMGISDHPEDQLMILNVLSNALYTDKVSAVLREYGCNAFDANVEAGRGEKPIEVRLPNKLDATVAIRDFGLGMTEEQILQTFCKLGRSTKRSSNAFTGMLGIGSKAGFAYGDSFTVTSYAEGLKTIYGCTRLNGVPTLSKMHQEQTDAPDGVEVKVPVRQADIPEFITKAERVFRYFKVRPIFHGAQIDFDKVTYKFSGTGWRFTGAGRSVAIMGNVGYDISETSLGSGQDVGYGGKIWTLIKAGIELDFNIGDLEIAANREGLQYRDHTKKALLSICKTVVAEISKVFTDKLKNATSLWEATKIYAELFENRGNQTIYSDYNISTIVANTVTWKGRALNRGRFSVGNKENDPHVHVTEYTRQVSWQTRKVRRHDRYIDTVHPHNTMLVVNDMPSKANSPTRMLGAFETHTDIQNIIVFAFDDTATQKKFWKLRELEGAPTTDLSSITPSTTNIGSNGTASAGPSVHRAKHSASAFVLDESGAVRPYGSARSLSWHTEQVNLKKDKGVYVVLDSFFVLPPVGMSAALAHQYDGESLLGEIKKLRAAGLLAGHPKIYGFKTARATKLEKNWTPLRDQLKNEVDAVMTASKSTFTQELADYIAAKSTEPRWNVNVRSDYPVGSLMRAYLDDVHRMQNPKANKPLMELIDNGYCTPWMQRPTLGNASVDLTKQLKEVLKAYPILDLINEPDSRSWSPAERAHVVAYIKMIGK